MKKYFYFLMCAVMVMSSCFLVGCDDKDDPDNPSNAVPDPEGTITANISEKIDISIDRGSGYHSYIHWKSPDNFYLYGGIYYYNPDKSYLVSICNLGTMSGLGNITKIPTSGFTIPEGSNYSVACEVGHGYVVKFEREDGQYTDYLRLYVVESIVDTGGGIMGAKVKYQYPFEPK
jgi:hypothetical protein